MSEFMEAFHFLRPAWLLLVPLTCGLWLLWQRRADPLHGWRQQIAPELLQALVVGNHSASPWPARWVLLAWVSSVVAIAGPTWKLEPNPFADDATPLMIVFKADVSMEESDLAPSRLERSRLKVADLAAARRGRPLGLIAYAGSAHLVLPPTRDTDVVARLAAEITPEVMPVAGDRLDLALHEAGRVLDESPLGGSIVAIADSVDTPSQALQGASAAYPLQFLAVNRPGSSQDDSLSAAASQLGARVETITADDHDIAAIVRRASRNSTSVAAESGGQWQEAGYWLVPWIALVVLASFRRDADAEEHA